MHVGTMGDVPGASRIRHRQGRARLVNGVPYADRHTTLSLLPGAATARWLVSRSGDITGRVLDLGAGNQPFRPWYQPLSEWTVAVDAAPADGIAALSSADAVPFRTGSFDTVLCTSVLEHVEDVESAMDEIVRIMKPGARILMSVPFLYPTHEAPWDFWRTTHFGVRSLLERHGLEVEDVGALGGPFVLAAHYLIQSIVQALGLLSSRLGRWARLTDNRLLSALLALPQEIVRSRISYRLSPLAKIASLGYMAAARKPGTLSPPRARTDTRGTATTP